MNAEHASLIPALPLHPANAYCLQSLQQKLQIYPFVFNNFQGARPASPSLSTPCMVAWGRMGGVQFPFSLFHVLSSLSRLECALPRKHRALRGFGRNCCCTNPLESALTRIGPRNPFRMPSSEKRWGEGCRRPHNTGTKTRERVAITGTNRFLILLIPLLLCLLLTVTSSLAAASQSPDQTEMLLSDARALFLQGNFTEADRAVRQYLQNHPDSADGHFLLGHILFREISAKWLEEGKAEGEALLYNTGDLSGPLVAYRDAKAKESLAEFTAGAKYHVPCAVDLKIVALDYLLLKDNNDADHWLTRSLQEDPHDAQAWYYLGRTKYGKGQFLEAIEAFAQCLKLEPRKIKAETSVGLSYEALERAEEAAQAFQNAITWQAENSAKDPEPFIELGHLYVNQNQPEKAVPYLTQSIAIFPRISKAHEELGKAYSLLKRFPEAQAELEKAIELTPQVPNLHCLLAPVYRKQGFDEKAKAESDRCAALSGTHSTS